MRKPRTAGKRSVASGFLTLLFTTLAAAQEPSGSPTTPPFTVEVEKDDLAFACPDLPWFKARIASHIGKAKQAGSFKIALGRQTEVWQAKIERRQADSSSTVQERVLQDRSPSCEPLAEAVAVTVAILADDVVQREESVPDRPSDNPPVGVTDSPKVDGAESRTTGAKAWVGMTGGAAMSFVSPVAPVFGIAGDVDYGNLRTGIRFMMTTEQKFDLDPGRVFVQAWLATIYGCLQGTRGHLGTALCITADASMLRASADGFDEGKPGTRSYEAIGLEVHPSWYVSENFRVSAVLGASMPFTRESFSVTGRGVAYVPPRANLRILLVSEIGAF
jgi:hypothetical protein